MTIEVNGMKLRGSNELYLHTIGKYLTIVHVEDNRTGMKKEYAGFLDARATAGDITEIMKTGFKPDQLSNWLNENLRGYG
jgi:hypothetical protein